MKASIQRMKNDQIDAHSLIKNNQPKTEIPTADYKAGGKSVKLPLIYWLFTIFLNFGYVHVISSQE